MAYVQLAGHYRNRTKFKPKKLAANSSTERKEKKKSFLAQRQPVNALKHRINTIWYMFTSKYWSNFLSKLPGDLNPKIHVCPMPCWVLESLAFKTVICKYNFSLWRKKNRKKKKMKKKMEEKKKSFVSVELNIRLRRYFKTWSRHDALYVGLSGSWPYGTWSWGQRCWERLLPSSMPMVPENLPQRGSVPFQIHITL